ncbi:hypothetical protein, conserved [Eimeria maxima]|uniref:Uncharacterized protein n=1 Tax=Eimeria maxima TaxID=5804 RepID=U6M9L1_EIMMA|nr:hypothetical protein, conserved [Eimeria maxima]CDJ59164.1 hypothetical protein, conserved [Eimeria maxima]
MDLCSFCCTDEADVGVAPYDRIAAHIGLSDDDLLDFESDNEDAPSLVNAAAAAGKPAAAGSESPKRRNHKPPKFKNRVSSEVYRLEESVRRSREQQQLQQQLLQQNRGSLSRSFGSSSSKGSRSSGSLHRSPIDTDRYSAAPAAPAAATAANAAAISSRTTSQEPLLRRGSSRRRLPATNEEKEEKKNTNKGGKEEIRQQNSKTNIQDKNTQRRYSGVRRLSDMTAAEKAMEKERLQTLVKEFAKEAVAGFDVTLLDLTRDRRAAATFSMDRHLLKISLISREEEEIRSSSFGVLSLTGAYKGEEYYKEEHFYSSSSSSSYDLTSTVG